MTLPLRIDRTGGTGKVQEFNPTSETLDDRVMPDALPDIWDAIADGSTITAGTRVFSNNNIYICSTTHTKGLRPEQQQANWDEIGLPLSRLNAQTNNGATSSTSLNANGIDSLRFRMVTSTTGSTDVSVSESNGVGEVAYRFNTTDFGSGQGSGVTSGGFGLNVDGTRVDLDYSDPEMIFTLSKQTPIKDFIRTDGTLTSINFELPPASGTGNNIQYTQTFNRDSSGVLTSITIGLRATPTTALATKTFNRTGGVLTGITIS